MEITVTIPDDLARRLGATGELERRFIEALVLDEYQRGRLTKPELRRFLGIATGAQLDEFLKAHAVFEPYTIAELEDERRDLERLGF